MMYPGRNRALKTAGLEGSQRPDVIVKYDDGSAKIIEYASPSQATGTTGWDALEDKMSTIIDKNTNGVR